jgi:hypothetical protein
MATISAAINKGTLDEFKLPEWELREPLRPLLVSPELFQWVDENERLVDGTLMIGGRTPFEHLVQSFCDLRCSERPGAGDLKRMTPTKHGVWKLHPPLLRVYGWFYEPFHFAAVSAALLADTKTDKRLNDQQRDYVRRFLSRNQLTETVLLGDHREVLPIRAR